MPRTDYDKIAHIYDEDEVRGKSVDRHLVTFLAKDGSPGPDAVSVLDIACGIGNQLIANKAAFPQVAMSGIDKSEGMLEQARSKSQDVTWIQGDLDQAGLTIGAFDYISCQFAYHHFQRKRVFLENVYCNLRDDGRFSLMNMDVFWPDDWYQFRFFPPVKTLDRQDFLETEAQVELARSVGFALDHCETEVYREELSLQEIQRRCRRRHNFSGLMAIDDSDYNAGMAGIEEMLQREETAVVESSLAILDVVFRKPR